MSQRTPELSIVIPVYNEQEVLPALFARLYPALDALGRPYEILFVNDGSRDRSAAILRREFEQRPDVTRVVLFANNFGQHRAVLAGFAHSRGRYVITLDADLQNPPEQIGRLLAELDAGHDYVGTVRVSRRDARWRRYASRLMNGIRARITKVRITDQGCMFRGYGRGVVDAVNQCSEYNTFVPALAYTFSIHPTEIDVPHEDRRGGRSKYSIWRLIRLNFDLMTGFSTVPVQVFSAFGMVVALMSGVLFLILAWRRVFLGSEVEGVFTLFALAFMFIGTALFGIGLVGEYVGRIYDEVRHRPRYIVGALLEQATPAASESRDETASRQQAAPGPQATPSLQATLPLEPARSTEPAPPTEAELPAEPQPSGAARGEPGARLRRAGR